MPETRRQEIDDAAARTEKSATAVETPELPGDFLELNGAHYYVRDSGAEGAPVLFIHGWPDDGGVWRHQSRAIAAAGYRAVVPDMLGYGRSERPPVERCSYPALAEDMLGLIEYLGGRCHLVAHDYGAILAWALATLEPARLLTFTAFSVGHSSLALDLTFERMRAHWVTILNELEAVPELYGQADGRLLREVIRSHPDKEALIARYRDDEALASINTWERANPLREFAALVLAGLPDPPPVEVATLGIYGETDDFLWQEQLRDSGRFVASEWRYEQVQGAGHWLMLEEPQMVNSLLLNWLGLHGEARG